MTEHERPDDRLDEHLDERVDPVAVPEEGDVAIAVTPQHPGMAAVVPDDAQRLEDDVSADVPLEDTSGEPLDPERREALDDHEPYD